MSRWGSFESSYQCRTALWQQRREERAFLPIYLRATSLMYGALSTTKNISRYPCQFIQQKRCEGAEKLRVSLKCKELYARCSSAQRAVRRVSACVQRRWRKMCAYVREKMSEWMSDWTCVCCVCVLCDFLSLLYILVRWPFAWLQLTSLSLMIHRESP